MEHIEKASVLGDDDAVALRMPFGFDQADTVSDDLRSLEIVICTVGICCTDDIFAFKFQSIGIFR